MVKVNRKIIKIWVSRSKIKEEELFPKFALIFVGSYFANDELHENEPSLFPLLFDWGFSICKNIL